jgi:hypothetical protein
MTGGLARHARRAFYVVYPPPTTRSVWRWRWQDSWSSVYLLLISNAFISSNYHTPHCIFSYYVWCRFGSRPALDIWLDHLISQIVICTQRTKWPAYLTQLSNQLKMRAQIISIFFSLCPGGVLAIDILHILYACMLNNPHNKWTELRLVRPNKREKEAVTNITSMTLTVPSLSRIKVYRKGWMGRARAAV